MGESSHKKAQAWPESPGSSHSNYRMPYELWQRLMMMRPEVQHGQRFMGPWEGPNGSMDEDIWGMPRLYSEDELKIRPKSI